MKRLISAVVIGLCALPLRADDAPLAKETTDAPATEKAAVTPDKPSPIETDTAQQSAETLWSSIQVRRVSMAKVAAARADRSTSTFRAASLRSILYRSPITVSAETGRGSKPDRHKRIRAIESCSAIVISNAVLLSAAIF